jgi:hypothetical protein
MSSPDFRQISAVSFGRPRDDLPFRANPTYQAASALQFGRGVSSLDRVLPARFAARQRIAGLPLSLEKEPIISFP